jgi:hypothetical protein
MAFRMKSDISGPKESRAGVMPALRASRELFIALVPDLTVGAIACRPFGPMH